MLTTTAGLPAAAVPMSASADERPRNYGTCVSYEAMLGESVHEFTEFFGPGTVVGGSANLPRGGDRIAVACGIPAGSPDAERTRRTSPPSAHHAPR